MEGVKEADGTRMSLLNALGHPAEGQQQQQQQGQQEDFEQQQEDPANQGKHQQSQGQQDATNDNHRTEHQYKHPKQQFQNHQKYQNADECFNHVCLPEYPWVEPFNPS